MPSFRLPILSGIAIVWFGWAAVAQDTPANQHGMSVTRTANVPVSAKAAFDFVAAENVLPKVLTGYGMLPAVVGTSGNTGPWTLPGSQRTVHLADGNTAREEVTHYRRAQYFAYRVTNPTFALRSLIDEARGEWWFTPTESGTQIRWTYTFQPSSTMAKVPLAIFLLTQWGGYMDTCMANIVKLLSRAELPSGR